MFNRKPYKNAIVRARRERAFVRYGFSKQNNGKTITLHLNEQNPLYLQFLIMRYENE